MTHVPAPWVFDNSVGHATEPVIVNGDHVLPEELCTGCHLLYNAHLPRCPEEHE